MISPQYNAIEKQRSREKWIALILQSLVRELVSYQTEVDTSTEVDELMNLHAPFPVESASSSHLLVRLRGILATG